MGTEKVTEIKGEALLSELGWVKHKKGIEGVEKVIARVNARRPQNLALVLSDVNGKEWYPVETQRDLLRAIADEYGGVSVLKEVGAHGVRSIAQFGFVLRFMSVKLVARKMEDNLKVLYKMPGIIIKDLGEKELEVAIYGFPEYETYSMLLSGGVEEMLRILKTKNSSVATTKVDNGVRLVLSWE